MNMNVKKKGNAGFTLLELLIVISIIAILAVALVLVLNPGETLKKSRDAQRISDLGTIKTALGIYLTSTSTPKMSLDNTCATIKDSLTRPIYTTDGTGWVDVNLNALTGGAPISTLPRDPLNDADHSYRYACEQATMTFEVSAVLESQAYKVDDNKAANDGGSDPLRYEVGTKLSL